MCLLALAVDAHPRYSLVLAANRDEFYDRPTAAAAYWPDTPGVLAGRDLRSGGTWLGIDHAGRFAALTNYRDPSDADPARPSRGQLVSDYLTGKLTPDQYARMVFARAHDFNGFCLVVGNRDAWRYVSNHDHLIRPLATGVHTLSNHLLNTPWPKSCRIARGMTHALQADSVSDEALFALLADRTPVPDTALPDTGVGLALEQALAPVFVATERYGTRCSTVIRIGRDGKVDFTERTFALDNPGACDARFNFAIDSDEH